MDWGFQRHKSILFDSSYKKFDFLTLGISPDLAAGSTGSKAYICVVGCLAKCGVSMCYGNVVSLYILQPTGSQSNLSSELLDSCSPMLVHCLSLKHFLISLHLLA
jgi:hypothetical protein